MPECNCTDYGWHGKGHNRECAVALDKEAAKIHKDLERAKKHIVVLRLQARSLRTVLRKAHSALSYTASYLDKEDSPSVVRAVDNALLATSAATAPRTKRSA